MNRILRRAVLAAGTLGVAGGIALTAVPASAAPLGDPPPSAVAAWGASAFGPIFFPPVAYATPSHTPAVASNANYTNFLTTGMILSRASWTTSYSRVDSPLVTLPRFLQATISADQVTSYCHTVNRYFSYGNSRIFSGSVSQINGVSYNPLTDPAPNTYVQGGGFSVTFNRQVVMAGVRTVTAIYVRSGPETLSIGVTRCGVPRES